MKDDEIENNKNIQEKESIKDIQKEEPDNIIKTKKNQINDKEEPLIKDMIETKEKKRYFGIDLIRVFACYLVIQTHAGEIYYIGDRGVLLKDEKNKYPGVLNSFARICVPLFIMISGYLLLPMKTDYTTFLKKRFTRVSIPFIVFCIAYDVFFCIKGDIDIKTMFMNIPKISINYGTELGHLWYIYMIMGIYLFIPIISPWIKTAEKDQFYYYFILWFISLFHVYIHYIYPEVWGECYWNNTSLIQSFLGNNGYAVLGAFIKIHLKNHDLYILGAILYIIGTGITTLGYFLRRPKAETSKDIELTWHFNTINVAMATFGMFLLLRKIECKNKIISSIFNDIALKSYGMYLIHIFFLLFFKYILDAPNQNPGWCIFAIAFLTFIVSYFVVKVISYIPYSQYVIG
jgi:surface polysaccharide O-acyltransferase-like enzyme